MAVMSDAPRRSAFGNYFTSRSRNVTHMKMPSDFKSSWWKPLEKAADPSHIWRRLE